MKKVVVFCAILLLLTSCVSMFVNQGRNNIVPYNLQIKKGLNKYQADFVYLATLCEQTFPLIDSVFCENKRQQMQSQIIARLGKSDVNKLLFSINCQKYLSQFHCSHIWLDDFRYDSIRIFPYALFYANKTWTLGAVSKDVDSSFIGKKVVSINNINVDTVMNKISMITRGENFIGIMKEIQQTQYYNKPQICRELGLFSCYDSAFLQFADGSMVRLPSLNFEGLKSAKIYKREIEKKSVYGDMNENYDYRITPDFAYIRFTACMDKPAIFDGVNQYIKPFFRPLAKIYLQMQFKRKNPSKIVRQYYNKKYPIFKDFLYECFKKMQEKECKTLVVDLRGNHGGDFRIPMQLFYYLTDKKNLLLNKEYFYTTTANKNYDKDEYSELKKYYKKTYGTLPPDNKLVELPKSDLAEIIDKDSDFYIPENRPVFKGKIYVLADFSTYSAASLLTSLIQDNGIATVIGTSVVNNPTGATTFSSFKLPKTGITGSVASSYIVRADKTKGEELIPDIWYEPEFDDIYLTNDKIFNFIKRK